MPSETSPGHMYVEGCTFYFRSIGSNEIFLFNRFRFFLDSYSVSSLVPLCLFQKCTEYAHICWGLKREVSARHLDYCWQDSRLRLSAMLLSVERQVPADWLKPAQTVAMPL